MAGRRMEVVNDPDVIELGENIRIRRMEAGISQEELAERVGVIGNTVSRIENAETVMKVDKFFRISEALEVTPDFLLPKRLFKRPEEAPLETLSVLWRRLDEANQKLVYSAMLPLITGLLENQKRQ